MQYLPSRTRLQMGALVAVLVASACSAENPLHDGGLDARDNGRRDVRAETLESRDIGTIVPVCGDSRVSGIENCDDGNTMSGDGCDATCTTVEPNYVCTVPGSPCMRTTMCGDGRLDADETCDDRNTAAADGCDATCHLETGWICATPGTACRAARCGDGLRIDDEECDDGNAAAGDGCAANCRLEDGFQCPSPGMTCTRTSCGDRRVEGTEQCDDGNNTLGDGCDPFCRREPRCTDGTCTAVCGDGVRLPAETCDDGNQRSGDGCSATCTAEMGFRCSDGMATEPANIAVPIVYRDFRGADLPGGHTDFENAIGSETGIVGASLAAGRLVYAAGTGSATTHGAGPFNQWYTDVSAVNRSFVERLTLTRMSAGLYVFDDAEFYPLDGRGWVAAGMEPARISGHNYSFTSELRYWFQYRGGEQLSFRGDDDVWVFINGRLAVDLGGVHGAQAGSVTLDAARATMFSLRAGGIYEAAVFQAERHTSESSYRLTLAGFNAPRSTCESICGDGIVTRFEACDDGTNDGRYGGCMPGCLRRAPYCGDGMLQRDAGEQCDDGNMVSRDGCSAMCRDESVG